MFGLYPFPPSRQAAAAQAAALSPPPAPTALQAEQTIRFQSNVAAATTETLSRTIRRPGRIRSIRVRIYIGAELDLALTVALDRAGRRIVLPDLEGATALVGDDDEMVFALGEPVQIGDVLSVTAVNSDAVNSHPYSVDCDMEWGGGYRG